MEFRWTLTFFFLLFLLEVLNLNTFAEPVEIKKCITGDIEVFLIYGVFDIDIMVDDEFTDICTYITAESNIVASNIEVNVSSVFFNIFMKNVRTKQKTKVKVTLPSLPHCQIRGISDTNINFTKLDNLNVSLDGDQKIYFFGRLKALNLISSGVSHVHLENLFSEEVNLQSTGITHVYAKEKNNILLHKNNTGILKLHEN